MPTKANTQVELEIAVKLRLMICVSFIGSQSKILDIATQPYPQAMLPMLHCHIIMIPDTILKRKRTLPFFKID